MKALVAAARASLSLVLSVPSLAEQRKTMPNPDVSGVAPALQKYADGAIRDLWQRPDLSPRDRSIVTLSAMIARGQTADLADQIALPLDNGVKPREISEIITHLAFYSGWPNAMAAVAVAKRVFAERKIGADQLPLATPSPLPLDRSAEAQRAERVGQQFGAVSPSLHLAFYAGWPNAFSALPVAKDVFEKRPR